MRFEDRAVEKESADQITPQPVGLGLIQMPPFNLHPIYEVISKIPFPLKTAWVTLKTLSICSLFNHELIFFPRYL